MITSEASTEITKVVEQIVEALHPQKVIMFGSHVSGEVTPDSDLDLLVIMETDLPFAERHRQVSRAVRPRPMPLDIIVRTPREIQESLRRVDPFMHEVLEKGFVLYARG